MPDITMCSDAECPKRETCWRFTAKPSPKWQSYFAKSPRKDDEGKEITCRHYWPVPSRDFDPLARAGTDTSE